MSPDRVPGYRSTLLRRVLCHHQFCCGLQHACRCSLAASRLHDDVLCQLTVKRLQQTSDFKQASLVSAASGVQSRDRPRVPLGAQRAAWCAARGARDQLAACTACPVSGSLKRVSRFGIGTFPTPCRCGHSQCDQNLIN